MAYILFNKGERSLINTWLGGFTNLSDGVPGSNVYVGMATRAIASTTKASNLTNTGGAEDLIEIGCVNSGGYSRFAIGRTAGSPSGSTWPDARLVGTSYQTISNQALFTFSNTPEVNGARMWFVALSGPTPSRGSNDAIFGADLAAQRNFAAGDTERITITYRQT
jgi:hypothetical protein